MKCFRHAFFVVLLSLGVIQLSQAQPIQLTVQASKPTVEIQPTMWGVFFEDINFGADGGLYAELVKNRSFEFTPTLKGWKEYKQGEAKGKVLIINRGDELNNPRFARFSVEGTGLFGLVNEGFRGMGVFKDKQYNFSVLARKNEGTVKIKLELVDEKGNKLGEASLDGFTDQWAKYSVSFTCKETEAKASLRVLIEGKGALDMDMISLFPKDTWKQRPNGLRADLVQLLADMKPGFIRFPGGCIVEGFDLKNRYQWKNTIGNVEDRKLIMNRWNIEFPYRNAPDYFQSFGLGFFEYFQLCEDIGAEPLPIMNCGMACQFNSGEVANIEKVDTYVQDVLDLIEFANGSETSKWGSIRAKMGHKAPFNMKMVGIGNEQWDEQYIERLKLFQKAIKDKYPSIRLVTSSGPDPDGKRFDYLWKEHRAAKIDIVDEHFYRSPEWFLKNVTRYDKYDRTGPKVFAGEYACHNAEDKNNKDAECRNTWEAALMEAAVMTGFERNADVVQMASYAPLFAHVDAWQWRPDMIWMNNLKSVATPNYYVQKAFSANRGTNVVPILNKGLAMTGKDSLYASASIDKKTNEVIIKIVNIAPKATATEISLDGVKLNNQPIVCQVLSSMDKNIYNTVNNPAKIVPVEKTITPKGKKIAITLDAQSLTLLRVKLK